MDSELLGVVSGTVALFPTIGCVALVRLCGCFLFLKGGFGKFLAFSATVFFGAGMETVA